MHTAQVLRTYCFVVILPAMWTSVNTEIGILRPDASTSIIGPSPTASTIQRAGERVRSITLRRNPPWVSSANHPIAGERSPQQAQERQQNEYEIPLLIFLVLVIIINLFGPLHPPPPPRRHLVVLRAYSAGGENQPRSTTYYYCCVPYPPVSVSRVTVPYRITLWTRM